MNKIEQKQIEEILEKVGTRCGMDVGGISYIVNAHKLAPYLQLKLPKDKIVIDKHKYILANKCYSDTTLKSWRKEDLIEHIRILEHNWASAEERLNNQVNYLQDKVVFSREEYSKNLQTHYYMGQRETEVYYETIKIPQSRKETAREYHEKMRNVIHERDYISGYAEIGLQEENNEIAKQYEVAVENDR